ncbi:synaptotagmin-11-like isoform X2 [Mercenaria mercenaria]|uniref:synaptotagmin-11-like isoform X2 n=1 Tax=Mercenaria mercenaria TaxID=6596 RepID=UPI001E1D710C|nr:synaptotagmin-11-like isoform X2 [Mercenaria mercenaria]
MGRRVPTVELTGIIIGVVTLGICSFVIIFVCLKYPSIRSRTFWDRSLKRLIRRLYSGVRKKEKSEDKKSLVMGPMQNKKQEQTKFVVPQIFVDYGSRRQSYASDYLRRCSAESLSSRRTSIASNETDRRGSGSSLSSRRTSLASNDRRGSGSSLCSRRTSLLSDCTSRRSSGSSRSSRKGSNASSGRYDDTDELLADLSDSETLEMDEMYTLEEELPPENRRSSLEEPADMQEQEKKRKRPRPYRRSHSLAEIRRPTAIFIPEIKQPPLPGRPRPDGRRVTLSSLVVSSLNALDHTPNPVAPPYQRKKPKLRPPGIGLPDTPVMMHDLNLEEMMTPRYATPLQPTGRLKVQLQFTDNALNVIIIEAGDLRIAGLPSNTDVNPYVKAFLVPGRTFKYRTKTINKSRTPVFLEKFSIQEITREELSEDSALEFQVYSSHHITRRHLVGMAAVQLKDIDKYENGLVDLVILPHSVYRLHQGDIHISGCYQPVAGKMVFSVVEARTLPRVSLLGAVNPYVKVEMYINGIREAKHKTKVRQNTQDPVWNQPCVFDINRENPKLLGHVFVFHIIHKDMMMGVQKIGQVELGWYSHGEQLDHWYEIMEHPHRPTDYWHPIIKTSKITS